MQLSKDALAQQILGSTHASAYREPNKQFDRDLQVTPEYKQTLPDIQNDIYSGIRQHIHHVGIHNFRLPLKWERKEGGHIELETSVTGTVSLEAESRGINMSRVIRTFYEFKDKHFNTNLVKDVLESYIKKIGSFDAKISLSISYPMEQKSLRSGLTGHQYYDVTFDTILNRDGKYDHIMHFDFVYSSACPCSNELSEHARKYRNRAAIPHSQRSTARISVKTNKMIWIEDIHKLCLDSLNTETQVMVLREDEQAFAELNGSYPKFVEDASRLLAFHLRQCTDISDFKVVLSHCESLHSHNAVAVIIKGIPGGFTSDVLPETYQSLVR